MEAMERKWARDTTDAVDALVGSTEVSGKRSRVDAVHLAFVSDMEVVKERDRRRDPNMKDKWSAVDASALQGVAAAISA